MSLQKNTASQNWRVFAFDKTNNNPKTGDAANITAKISKDGGADTATNDVNPTEAESGFYDFDLTQAETNADLLGLIVVSATANIGVVAVPGVQSTRIIQTGDSFGRLGVPAGASVSADVGAIPTTAMRGTDSAALASVATEARLAELDAANLPADVAAIPTTAMRGTDGVDTATMRGTDNALLASTFSTMFAGITALAQWLGLIAGKQVGNTTARTEVRATGAGAGTYDETTDSLEALEAVAGAIPTTAMRGTDNAALASVATEARLAELDAANLPTDIAAIPTTAMRGTDSAALASVATEARLAELDAANLPADVAAIPTTAMRGTDSAALASVATEARLAELDAANLPTDVAAIPTTAMRGTDNAATAAALTTAQTDLTAILADTNELQTDLANGGRIDLLIDAILLDTGELQVDWVNGGRLDLLIDAIKAKTDSLTFTKAGEVDANPQSINGTALVGDGGATPWGP